MASPAKKPAGKKRVVQSLASISQASTPPSISNNQVAVENNPTPPSEVASAPSPSPLVEPTKQDISDVTKMPEKTEAATSSPSITKLDDPPQVSSPPVATGSRNPGASVDLSEDQAMRRKRRTAEPAHEPEQRDAKKETAYAEYKRLMRANLDAKTDPYPMLTEMSEEEALAHKNKFKPIGEYYMAHCFKCAWDEVEDGQRQDVRNLVAATNSVASDSMNNFINRAKQTGTFSFEFDVYDTIIMRSVYWLTGFKLFLLFLPLILIALLWHRSTLGYFTLIFAVWLCIDVVRLLFEIVSYVSDTNVPKLRFVFTQIPHLSLSIVVAMLYCLIGAYDYMNTQWALVGVVTAFCICCPILLMSLIGHAETIRNSTLNENVQFNHLTAAQHWFLLTLHLGVPCVDAYARSFKGWCKWRSVLMRLFIGNRDVSTKIQHFDQHAILNSFDANVPHHAIQHLVEQTRRHHNNFGRIRTKDANHVVSRLLWLFVYDRYLRNICRTLLSVFTISTWSSQFDNYLGAMVSHPSVNEYSKNSAKQTAKNVVSSVQNMMKPYEAILRDGCKADNNGQWVEFTQSQKPPPYPSHEFSPVISAFASLAHYNSHYGVPCSVLKLIMQSAFTVGSSLALHPFMSNKTVDWGKSFVSIGSAWAPQLAENTNGIESAFPHVSDNLEKPLREEMCNGRVTTSDVFDACLLFEYSITK